MAQSHGDNRLLLFSGGLDSTALAATLRPEQTLTIDYGQISAAGEIRAAAAISNVLGLTHSVLSVDCSNLGSGLLAGREPDSHSPVPEWWPFRNQLLLTLAAAWALPRSLDCVLLGSVAGDDTHLDGSRGFYELADRLVSMQEGSLRIVAPAIDTTTEELLADARVPRGILGFTHSCHRAEFACGLCPGCLRRSAVLESIARR